MTVAAEFETDTEIMNMIYSIKNAQRDYEVANRSPWKGRKEKEAGTRVVYK